MAGKNEAKRRAKRIAAKRKLARIGVAGMGPRPPKITTGMVVKRKPEVVTVKIVDGVVRDFEQRAAFEAAVDQEITNRQRNQCAPPPPEAASKMHDALIAVRKDIASRCAGILAEYGFGEDSQEVFKHEVYGSLVNLCRPVVENR